MKKALVLVIVTVFALATVPNVKAQAWEKSTKVLALGFGASNFAHIYQSGTYYGWYGWNGPLTGQFNFQGEFGVHDYVGVGFTTGVGGRAGYYWGRFNGYGSDGEVNVPVGVIVNFHFFQLIADKTGKDIHSDKLDVYAGVDVGGGIAAQFLRNGNSQIIPIAFGGVHAGVRYYFTDHFGINGEVGTPYGKGFFNGGVVFRL